MSWQDDFRADLAKCGNRELAQAILSLAEAVVDWEVSRQSNCVIKTKFRLAVNERRSRRLRASEGARRAA